MLQETNLPFQALTKSADTNEENLASVTVYFSPKMPTEPSLSQPIPTRNLLPSHAKPFYPYLNLKASHPSIDHLTPARNCIQTNLAPT